MHLLGINDYLNLVASILLHDKIEGLPACLPIIH